MSENPNATGPGDLVGELEFENDNLRFQLKKSQAKLEASQRRVGRLEGALERLLKFNEELCEDIKISTNYPSAENARKVLSESPEDAGKAEREKEEKL